MGQGWETMLSEELGLKELLEEDGEECPNSVSSGSTIMGLQRGMN